VTLARADRSFSCASFPFFPGCIKGAPADLSFPWLNHYNPPRPLRTFSSGEEQLGSPFLNHYASDDPDSPFPPRKRAQRRRGSLTLHPCGIDLSLSSADKRRRVFPPPSPFFSCSDEVIASFPSAAFEQPGTFSYPFCSLLFFFLPQSTRRHSAASSFSLFLSLSPRHD